MDELSVGASLVPRVEVAPCKRSLTPNARNCIQQALELVRSSRDFARCNGDGAGVLRGVVDKGRQASVIPSEVEEPRGDTGTLPRGPLTLLRFAQDDSWDCVTLPRWIPIRISGSTSGLIPSSSIFRRTSLMSSTSSQDFLAHSTSALCCVATRCNRSSPVEFDDFFCCNSFSARMIMRRVIGRVLQVVDDDASDFAPSAS